MTHRKRTAVLVGESAGLMTMEYLLARAALKRRAATARPARRHLHPWLAALAVETFAASADAVVVQRLRAANATDRAAAPRGMPAPLTAPESALGRPVRSRLPQPRRRPLTGQLPAE